MNNSSYSAIDQETNGLPVRAEGTPYSPATPSDRPQRNGAPSASAPGGQTFRRLDRGANGGPSPDWSRADELARA
ncbi:MAG TPA: hypothetical protein VGP07_07745, partial [Polyangia bacterium]